MNNIVLIVLIGDYKTRLYNAVKSFLKSICGSAVYKFDFLKYKSNCKRSNMNFSIIYFYMFALSLIACKKGKLVCSEDNHHEPHDCEDEKNCEAEE